MGAFCGEGLPGAPEQEEMAILHSGKGDSRRITLEGAIDAGAAAELQAALVKALHSGQEVCVSIGGVTDLDVTAFQLLWAAEREAERLGARFRLEGPLTESVRQTLAELSVGELVVAEAAEMESHA